MAAEMIGIRQGGKLSVRDLASAHVEGSVNPQTHGRTLIRRTVGVPHDELARGNQDKLQRQLVSHLDRQGRWQADRLLTARRFFRVKGPTGALDRFGFR